LNFRISSLLRDPTNVAIVRALSYRPRIATSELAREIGMSAPAVRERIQRLEETGVIVGARLDLDPAQLGFPVGAFIRVRPLAGQLQKIVELANRTPRVIECHRITGEDCFLMRVQIESIERLDEILDAFLVFGQTTTSIIQSSPVQLRSLPLPEG